MSESRAFCPRCGDPVDRDSNAAGPGSRDADTAVPGPRNGDRLLCDACYFEQFDLVDAPQRIEVRVCSQCGAVHRGNRWVDVGARDYTDIAVEETTEALGVHLDARDVEWVVDPEQVDPNTIRMHCLFTGSVRDTPVEEEVTVPVYIARETCTRCGRIAGEYYASVVQVRATDRQPTDHELARAREIAEAYVADRETDGDREAFITEVSRTDQGLDLKLSTNTLGETVARRIVRELGGAVSSSETLVTEDEDGNEVYRVTFLARLPPFTPGEVVDPEDDDQGPVLVTSVRGNLKGVRLTTGEPYEASHEAGIAPDATSLGTREDAVETTLVAVEDDRAVQVIDPETYESRTVPRPDYLDPADETVPVLKSRAGLHVLPREHDRTE